MAKKFNPHPEVRRYISQNGMTSTPRNLSILLQLRTLLSSSTGMLGTLVIILTLTLSNVGLNDEFSDIFGFSNSRYVDGIVKEVNETNTEINDRTVMVVDFEYEVDGIQFQNFSFKTAYRPRVGSQVVIEYSPSDPQTSRIKGATLSMAGKGVLIPIGVYLIICLLFLRSYFKTFHKLDLLKSGHFSSAKLESEESTNVSVNEQTVMKLTYSFSRNGITSKYVVKTHNTTLLTDEEEEIILYNPKSMAKVSATLLDELPKGLAIKNDGTWYYKGLNLFSYLTQPILGGISGGFLSIFIYLFLK